MNEITQCLSTRFIGKDVYIFVSFKGSAVLNVAS